MFILSALEILKVFLCIKFFVSDTNNSNNKLILVITLYPLIYISPLPILTSHSVYTFQHISFNLIFTKTISIFYYQLTYFKKFSEALSVIRNSWTKAVLLWGKAMLNALYMLQGWGWSWVWKISYCVYEYNVS